MAEITLDKSTTALLMADFSAGNMAQNPIVKERQTFERAGAVLAAARHAGIFVTYCISHFRPGYPEIPAQNNPRSPMRASGAVLPADANVRRHPAIRPPRRCRAHQRERPPETRTSYDRLHPCHQRLRYLHERAGKWHGYAVPP